MLGLLYTIILSWNVNGLRAAGKKGFSAWLEACGAEIVGLLKAGSAYYAPSAAAAAILCGRSFIWCSGLLTS